MTTDSNIATLFIIAASVVILRFKYTLQQGLISTWLVNILFTVLHELAHAIIGFLTGAKPYSIGIFPRKNVDGSYTLGTTSFTNVTFYNALPTALAPLLLLVLAYYSETIVGKYIPAGIPGFIAIIALKIMLIDNSIPSPTDLRVAFSSITGIFLYLAIGLGIIIMVSKQIILL